MNKKAILLVSTGSSKKETLEKTLFKLVEEMKNNYKEYSFYLAFANDYILKKLQDSYDANLLDVETAFLQMKNEDIKEVYIQSTFLLDGLESGKVFEVVKKYQDDFEKIIVGAPLLHKKEDYMNLLQILSENAQLEEKEALVLVGHGTTHVANNSYQDFEYTAYTNGYRNVFVGTMGDEKSRRMVLRKLSAMGFEKVCLKPFLFVAGYHAKKDIEGEQNSWKTFLKENGYEVRVWENGLGELKDIRDILIRHLEKCL